MEGRLVVARTSAQRFAVTMALLPDLAQMSFPVLIDPAWVSTGAMGAAREDHTSTLLGNGKVLVAGGQNGDGSNSVLSSAELYDPTTGTFSATGPMAIPRAYYTATLLGDGKVLLAGGMSVAFTTISSAELYDPAAGTFGATGSLSIGRYDHTATLVGNGNVLVAGGEFGTSSTSTSGAGGAATSSGGASSGGSGTSGGCGCRAAPAPASGGLWAGLGLLIAVRRRRSRRTLV